MHKKLKFDRRHMLKMGAATPLLGLSACGNANHPQLDVKNLSPGDAFKSYIKTIGSLDTEDKYIWFTGVLWGAIPKQLPVAICGFQGLARHRWEAKPDGSFIQKAYDVGFFHDLETGQIADTITNPITGEKVRTYHNTYGGFEQVHTLEKFTAEDGKLSELDWSSVGDKIVMTERSSGQVKSKMQPEDWPRESSGPINYYGGETSYSVSRDDLSNPAVKDADYTMFWTSFSPWEPWLLMDGAAGNCQWRATGQKLNAYTDAPDQILEFVKKERPNYFDPADPWEGYLSNTDRFMRDRSPASK